MMVLDRTAKPPHRENDCISERCLLKHYRLWNDGLRPGIGPPRRKEGSRRGRPTIVIIATPLSTSHSQHRHHRKPFQHPHFHFSSLHLDGCQQLKFHKLQGTFHSSLRGFFTEHYKMCLKCFLNISMLNHPYFITSVSFLPSSCPIFLLIIHSIPA